MLIQIDDEGPRRRSTSSTTSYSASSSTRTSASTSHDPETKHDDFYDIESSSSDDSSEHVVTRRIQWFDKLILGVSQSILEDDSSHLGIAKYIYDVFPFETKHKLLCIYDSEVYHDEWVEPFVVSLNHRYIGSITFLRHVSHITKDHLATHTMLVLVDSKVSEFIRWNQTYWFNRVYLVTSNYRTATMQNCYGFFDGVYVAVKNKKADVLDVWRDWIGSPMRGRESQLRRLLHECTFEDNIMWSFDDEEFCLVDTSTCTSNFTYSGSTDVRKRSHSDNFLIGVNYC